MSSLTDIKDCPNCGNEATSEFYYQTSEEFITCAYCGYYKAIMIKDCNKRLEEVEDEDWEIVEIKRPYGAYRLKYKDVSVEECGTLITYDDFIILKDIVNKNLPDVESFIISRYKNGEIKETIIY